MHSESRTSRNELWVSTVTRHATVYDVTHSRNTRMSWEVRLIISADNVTPTVSGIRGTTAQCDPECAEVMRRDDMPQRHARWPCQDQGHRDNDS